MGMKHVLIIFITKRKKRCVDKDLFIFLEHR